MISNGRINPYPNQLNAFPACNASTTRGRSVRHTFASERRITILRLMGASGAEAAGPALEAGTIPTEPMGAPGDSAGTGWRGQRSHDDAGGQFRWRWP